jgi:two-component system, OmpR family, KDP operon response regulator KdpE
VPTQPRILVIDDDETILDLLKDTLSPNYQIATAHDSLEGVELMMSERFDLMIIDLGMPVLDGVELIQKIRANSPFDKIPILVLSAYPELRTRLRGSDVQAIMAKPFSVDQLQRTVAQIIEGEPRRTANLGSPPSSPPTPPPAA